MLAALLHTAGGAVIGLGPGVVTCFSLSFLEGVLYGVGTV